MTKEEYQRKVEENRAAGLINTTGIERAEVSKYLSKLREAVLILPASLPVEGWTEESIKEARALVRRLERRLKPFEELTDCVERGKE